jgi:hypothetical protein
MAIDPHNLPEGTAALHQIVLQLLQVVEDKDRLLERLQRQLEQLLRQGYGPKRERLRDLFSRISSHPHSRLDGLLPDRWHAAQSATQS